MKYVVSVALGLFVVGLASVALWYSSGGGGQKVSSEPVIASQSRQSVSALDRLLPGQAVLGIGAPPGDRITELKIREGQYVGAGEELAVLESQAIRAAERDLAKSKLEQGQALLQAEIAHGNAQLAEAQLGIQRAQKLLPLKLQTQENEVRLADIDARQAQLDLDRTRELAANKAATDERCRSSKAAAGALPAATPNGQGAQSINSREERQRCLAEAEARVKSAEAALAKAKQALALQPLEKALALAEANLQRSSLRAPIAGQILKIHQYPGEVTTGRSVLDLGDTREMYVLAEVYETDVGLVREGQSATITSRGAGWRAQRQSAAGWANDLQERPVGHRSPGNQRRARGRGSHPSRRVRVGRTI